MNKRMKFYPSSRKKQIFKIAEGKILLSNKNSVQYHSICRWTQDKLISEFIFRFATPLWHVSRWPASECYTESPFLIHML